jgi:hypothetical protein
MRTVIIAASAAAALFSSPAFTQQPSQGTASIRDFSRTWGHLALFVEPPLSGPGPVRNLSRMNHRSSPGSGSLSYCFPGFRPNRHGVFDDPKASVIKLNPALKNRLRLLRSCADGLV